MIGEDKSLVIFDLNGADKFIDQHHTPRSILIGLVDRRWQFEQIENIL